MTPEEQRAALNVSTYCPAHGALPGERCTRTTRACSYRKTIARGAVRGAQGLRTGLRTVADFLALPGIVGVHERADGLGTVALYVDVTLHGDDFAWLARYIDDHRPVNLIVRLERDRRTNERRQT